MGCYCGCNGAVGIQIRSRQYWGANAVCGYEGTGGALFGTVITTNNYDVYGPGGTVTGTCATTFTSIASGDLCVLEMVDGFPTSPAGCCEFPPEESESDCDGLPNCLGGVTNCRDFTGSTTEYSDPRPPAPTPALEPLFDWSEWTGSDGVAAEDFRGNGSPAASLGALALGSTRSKTDAAQDINRYLLEFRLAPGMRAPVRVQIVYREYLSSGGGSYTESTDEFMLPVDFSAVQWWAPLPSATGYVTIADIKLFIPGAI